jgi:hypothetical protein
MKSILRYISIILLAFAVSANAAEGVSPIMRVGVIEAEIFLYDVSAGGILEYRDDWSKWVSRQASISNALMLVRAGYSPIVLPDAVRSRDLFRLKTKMRYHGGAFQGDFFAEGVYDGDPLMFSIGALDTLCDRFGVDAFFYTYGYEERFSPERQLILAAATGSIPPERTFAASMLVDRSGNILWYDQAMPAPDAMFESDSESVHFESLIAQSRGMEWRFRHQNLLWEDRNMEEYLDEILYKLATPDEQRRYNLRVRILRNNAVDAFAAPDGTIYICTGLLARVTSETQIAAVLAHELAHVVKRHTERNLLMMKEYARAEVLKALSAEAAKAEPKAKKKFTPMTRSAARSRRASAPASAAAPRAAARRPGSGYSSDMMFTSMTGALRAAVAGYRQELEEEADSVAQARMAAAGYPPLTENFRQFIGKIVDLDNLVGDWDDEIDRVDREVVNARLRHAVLYDAVVNHAAGRHIWTDLQLDRVLSIDECDPSALLIRGDMERLMSPRSTAWAEWYEKALRCDPGDIAVLRAMGFAYHAIGDKVRAREYLSRYSELAGDAPDIKMVREVLSQCE